jgi:AraC-like DNA-binding protein
MGFAVHTLLVTSIVTVLDAVCSGDCQHTAGEAFAASTRLVFPYRGVYVCHVGGEDAVAEPNQVLFHNAGETCRISHPVAGGDASLIVTIEGDLLCELAPAAILHSVTPIKFSRLRMRIDPRAQALVAMLRYSLREGLAEPLEAETLSLTLAQRALGSRTAHAVEATYGQRKLVDRVKLVLTNDLARRWTLAEIAAEVGGSPVYLTQVFRQVEAVPLYRYQMRLRLAKALDLIAEYEDLTALGLDLGFSSHSHFSAAFKQAYGRSPTEFRDAVLNR